MLGYSLTRQFKSRPLGPGYSIVRDHKMIGLSGGLLAPQQSLTLQMLVGSSSSPKRDARWRWKNALAESLFGAERKGWITPMKGIQNGSQFFGKLSPENEHRTQKSPNWKGKSSFKPPFLGSMLIFRGVYFLFPWVVPDFIHHGCHDMLGRVICFSRSSQCISRFLETTGSCGSCWWNGWRSTDSKATENYTTNFCPFIRELVVMWGICIFSFSIKYFCLSWKPCWPLCTCLFVTDDVNNIHKKNVQSFCIASVLPIPVLSSSIFQHAEGTTRWYFSKGFTPTILVMRTAPCTACFFQKKSEWTLRESRSSWKGGR